MTYKEFYGSDYDQFKKVLDSILNMIELSSLACIQYTTFRIKSPESVMKKVGDDYSLLHDIIGVRIICSFVDEIYEDELEPVKPAQPETIQTATSEAHELLRKEIAAATADVPVKQEESVQTKPDAGDIHMEPVSGKTEVIVPQVKEQLKQMMNASDRKPVEAEETEGNAQEEIRRMVIPTWSAAQIAETARSQGDAPDIVRDDVTKVTLFDYSDIIADEKPVYPQKQTAEE